ncbi:hypothetical protein MMPV_009155 [Pyropia vietnamensis]
MALRPTAVRLGTAFFAATARDAAVGTPAGIRAARVIAAAHDVRSRPGSGAAAAAAGRAAEWTWTPPAGLTWALHGEDAVAAAATPSGWVPPLGAEPSLPVRVFRTAKGKQLPVYVDYKNGGTRILTILRRYRGADRELAEELCKVCDGRPVTVRPGSLEVKGNFKPEVIAWLLRLGF